MRKAMAAGKDEPTATGTSAGGLMRLLPLEWRSLPLFLTIGFLWRLLGSTTLPPFWMALPLPLQPQSSAASAGSHWM